MGNYVQQLEGTALSLLNSNTFSFSRRNERSIREDQLDTTIELFESVLEPNDQQTSIEISSESDRLSQRSTLSHRCVVRPSASLSDLISLGLDAAISAFQLANVDLFPKKRLLNQRIREIRQKLMQQYQQQQHQQQHELPRDI